MLSSRTSGTTRPVVPPYKIVRSGHAGAGLKRPDQSNAATTRGDPPWHPVVHSVTPTTGPSAGGTTITLIGQYFTGASAVNFGGVAGTGRAVANDTLATALAPPSALTGATGPSVGSSANNNAIVIRGSNLTTTTIVTFNGLSVTSLTVVDDGTLVIATPPHALGTVDVVLAALGGSVTAAGGFTYVQTLGFRQAPTGMRNSTHRRQFCPQWNMFAMRNIAVRSTIAP